MKKRAKGAVFQERTNTLSSPPSCQDPLFPLNQHQRTAYDTGVLSITPTMSLVQQTAAATASHEPLQLTSSDVIPLKEMDESRPLDQPLVNLFESGPPRTDYEAARAARYLKAEQALAATVQYSLEHHSSTRDLQIDALKQATSVLNAHIVDAKGQVERLRPLLSNGQAEFTAFRSMQRQRWMEERRQYAAEQLSKALEKHLATLTSLPKPTAATNASNAKPNSTVNLERFFESSRQRVQVRNRSRRRIIPPSRPRPEKKPDFPSVHHHRHLLSLKLTPPDPRLSFQTPRPTKPTEAPAAPNIISTELSPTVTSPETPSPISLAPIAEAREIDLSPPPSSGTATIWYSSPRTTEDILSNLVVSMPDYVSDLLAGLDAADSPQPSASLIPRLSSSHPSPSATLAPVPGPSKPQPHGPPPALRKSHSRRRLSNILALPEALSSRIGSFEGRTQAAASKRFSTPPPSSFPPRAHALDASITEEDASSSSSSAAVAVQQLSGRISFSASHLPDVTRSAPEGHVAAAASASHGALAGGNLKIVARLRDRISVLRKKP